MASASSSKLVFIVDANRNLLRQIRGALRKAGVTTATASTAQGAIDWLGGHQADLMLVDLELPDMPGREFIERLVKLPRPVPFIVSTAHGDEQVAVEMMKRGAIDYLVKAVDFLQFIPEVVQRAMVRLEREKKLAQAEEALRRSEANLAKAQQIAHLGSYEVNIPFSKDDYRSDEIFRIIGLEPREKEFSTEDYIERFIHAADRDHFRQVINKSAQEAIPFDFEYRIVRPDGAIRYVQSVGEPILKEAGKVVKIVGTLLDVTERKQLENAILEISEREQRRIGQDLHDGLGQHLAGIELMSRVLEQNLAAKGLEVEAERAAALAKYVREAISQTRLLARGLAPVVLESQGLMSALQELTENTQSVFGVSCQFRCEKPVPVENAAVATHLYRIAQEAVTNAIKHGKAKHIVIHLQSNQRRMKLTIEDDGRGLSPVIPKERGMGLRIMKYRASMIGAALAVQGEPGSGTTVVCSLEESKGAEP